MKICPVCNNHEPGDDALFCSECGYRFDQYAYDDSSGSYGGVEEDQSLSYEAEESAGRKGRSRRSSLSFSRHADRSAGSDNVSVQDRPVRQKWPFIAGGAALVIVLATAIYFGISDHNLAIKQDKQIQEEFSYIENLRNLQKDNYLDEALENWEGDTIYEKAKEIKEAEDTSKEQQISALKELHEKFDTYDEELISGQTRTLNEEYSKVQGKYEEAFLLDGEKEKIDAFEKDYGQDIDDHLFKAAKSILESYGELEQNIANDEDKGKKSIYSAKHLLDEDEFMPTILDFSVFDDSYTNNGEAMGADHFTLVEQIGEKGKKKYIDIDKVSMSIKNGEIMYVLKFQPSQPDNYDKGRGYVLHVRNMDGTRGFTTDADKTIPKKKMEAAVGEYLEDFVKAFNQDNSADSRSFNKMKEYLEKDSQAWNDYKDQPSRERITEEGITGTEGDPEIDIAKDHKSATVHVTFNYELGRYRTYSEICSNSKENSFCHDDNTSNKNFRIRNGYIGYVKGKGGEYRGQELSGSSRFLCHEYMAEDETFVIKLTNNSAGKITKHDNDDAAITGIEEMGYQENSSKDVYRYSDLDELFEEEEYYGGDAEFEDDY